MPDGDRFYRRLKGMGKGWMSIFRNTVQNGKLFLPVKTI